MLDHRISKLALLKCLTMKNDRLLSRSVDPRFYDPFLITAIFLVLPIKLLVREYSLSALPPSDEIIRGDTVIPLDRWCCDAHRGYLFHRKVDQKLFAILRPLLECIRETKVAIVHKAKLIVRASLLSVLISIVNSAGYQYRPLDPLLEPELYGC